MQLHMLNFSRTIPGHMWRGMCKPSSMNYGYHCFPGLHVRLSSSPSNVSGVWLVGDLFVTDLQQSLLILSGLEYTNRVEGDSPGTYPEYSLRPRRTGFDSRRNRSRTFTHRNSSGLYRWSSGFLGNILLYLPLHSGAAPYSPDFIFIGSQDIDKRRLPRNKDPALPWLLLREHPTARPSVENKADCFCESYSHHQISYIQFFYVKIRIDGFHLFWKFFQRHHIEYLGCTVPSLTLTRKNRDPVFPNTFIQFPRKNVGLEDANRTIAYLAEGTQATTCHTSSEFDSSLVAPRSNFPCQGRLDRNWSPPQYLKIVSIRARFPHTVNGNINLILAALLADNTRTNMAFVNS
ncbi:hypothetical protein PR048_018302 [Dryococelus australis]|uniref:Uncharacterized protein n=1 Tax=Dryococelus australis TaxID=614101 RepID=A0ABQ9HC07_9NEOP|nr:hypothetical protein PR048_018302 [Dryococelus australis]